MMRSVDREVVVSATVVVGVDGSPSSLAAVDLAAREARMRRCELKVVHAFVWPMTYTPLASVPLGPPEGSMREMVGEIVAEAVERARAAEPEVEVTNAVVGGEPLMVLESQSHQAALIVVGSRGRGGFAGLLLGSTAVHLAAHGRCPTMVVRGGADATGPVLLGVDGSPAGDGAVGFAFEEAALRGTDLVAHHAWKPWSVAVTPPLDPTASSALDPVMLEAGERRLVAEALAGRHERYPDVPVRPEVVRGGAREALIEASREAGLVVVGARGRGGFAGLLLGSVSQALLHHAHCPVAVVRKE
ncbi:universal stress protein [Streptomyces sp. GSL17-111]|uniref:universal stress protein n=1 Tax=Streptomyces sp. GSL17-111 TaxID=3121596 RepID=UPI0030F37675